MRDASTIRKQILALLPGAEISVIEEYLQKKNATYWDIQEISLSKNFVYPLEQQNALVQYDPIAYFSSHMTQLKHYETVLMQLVITPVTKNTHRSQTKFIRKVTRSIEEGKDAVHLIKHHNAVITRSIGNIFLCFAFLLVSPFGILAFFLGGAKGDILPFWLFRENPKKQLQILSDEKKATQQTILTKIKKDLFAVNLRVYVAQDNRDAVTNRMSGFLSSFQALHTDAQKLQSRGIFPLLKSLSFFTLRKRLPIRQSFFSVSELANIYHFPYSPITHTEDLLQSKTQELPVPLSIKKDTEQFAITFAKNTYGGAVTPVGLTKDIREEHMYIIGGTKMGKSTLLQTMIHEDITKGRGLCVIDPHGDLITNILSIIPESRYEDVILLDPDDMQASIGLNILYIPETFTDEALLRKKDAIASTFISLFNKLFPLKTSAHRQEHMLRMSILTALETKDPTLFTIQKLLTEYDYRKQVVETLKDPILKQFWKKEFNSMGSFQRSEAVIPITSKLSKFITSHISRNILLRRKSTINFSEIMNDKKILLCNLSKGKIGEDMSSFFGALITAHIELAALERARIPLEERNDFYLYIDEFQNFASPSFAKILSESRKYGLYGTFAHQTTAQIEDKSLIEEILANTGTVIAFRTGSTLDERYILPSFMPEVKEGQIVSLPAHHFYIKVKDSTPKNAFTGETIKQERIKNPQAEEIIRHHSQENYATPKDIIEKEIEEIIGMPLAETNIAKVLQKAKEHYLQN